MENNGEFQLRYDERNRLERVTVGALTTTYGVNGLGERVAKDGQQAFGKVEHVYDLVGQVLGIYKSGAPLEEIVWLGDLPVGTIQGGAAYSIAPDHLGAPYKIVNSSNTQVWFWDHDPFGNGAPTAAAGFAHRLRFPGQVYDAESGLHSNGQRDYDPRLGRYVESDPIGLEGGINTYAYAWNDPVNAVDPLGLDPMRENDDDAALPTIEIGAQRFLKLVRPYIDFQKIGRDISGDPWGSMQAGLDGLGAIGAVSAGSIRIAGRVAAAAKTPLWTSTKLKSAVKNAFGHWQKHRLEFPEFQNAKQYVEGAKEFFRSPPSGTLTKTRPDGDRLFYNPANNTFGVQAADGAPRTMFRPTDGINYWNEQ